MTQRPSSGRFITFEGGEGAGKSTQARLLADALLTRGHEVLLTREPGGTPSAELIRQLVLDPSGDWSLSAEIMLHFAARADHLDCAIRPALERGAWVVCDRFADSTMAYQGQGEGRELITSLTRLLPVRPDVTIILDVTAETRRARLASRAAAADRYERQSEAFHAGVAARYRDIAAADPARCVLIPACGDRDEIRARILHAVDASDQGEPTAS